MSKRTTAVFVSALAVASFAGATEPAAKPPVPAAVKPAAPVPAAAAKPEVSSPAEDAKILYAVGLAMARNLTVLSLTPAELDEALSLEAMTQPRPIR